MGVPDHDRKHDDSDCDADGHSDKPHCFDHARSKTEHLLGVEITRILHAPISLAIVRKIQIPGNSEAGFGAVTWDGHVLINEQTACNTGTVAEGG